MTKENLQEKDFYRTTSLSLAAVIFLFYPLETIDRQNPRKAHFLFRCSEGLDNLVEKYWRKEARVEPQAYFDALRVIKARLYGEE